MVQRAKTYFTKEDGAVTVDWVVLTAAIVGIALAAIISIHQGTDSFGQSVNDFLTETTVEELAGI